MRKNAKNCPPRPKKPFRRRDTRTLLRGASLRKFPKKWKNEFQQLNKIGFNYLELIYDRDQSPLNPLTNKKLNHKKISKIINKTSIKKVYAIGNDIKETFYAIDRKKRGRILRNKNEIYHLIKNDLNNNDHLMIKASNSTGLNSVALNIKKGKIYAL